METRRTITISGTTGSADTDLVRGFVEAVEVVYGAGVANTTTVTITENDDLGRTIATFGASNTNSVQYPRAAAVNTAGSAITNSFARIYLSGHTLHIAVANSTDTAQVTVIVYISESWRE